MTLQARGNAALALVLVAGVAVRVAGLWTQLWLDEIWSLNIARAFSYADIVWRVPFDNNHILNTLWLRWVGEPAWWGWYRLHSLAAGLAAVLLLWRAASRWGALEGALAAGLASASYLLTLYSSEARGYMLMIAFTAGAFLSLDSWLRSRSPKAYAGWSACVVLGFFSHLTFAQAYGALAAWSCLALLRGRGRGAALRDVMVLHAPAAAAALVYLAQLRAWGYGGGPPFSPVGILRETLALAFGSPDGAWAWVAGVIGLGAAAWAVWDLARRGSQEWLFFAVVVFAAPAALLALKPPLLFPRYFLLAVAFSIPLLARAAAAALRSGPVGALIAASALTLYGAGNFVRAQGFVRDGRGHYLEALRYIAQQSEGHEVTIGSGHDFATNMIVQFYARRVPGASFRYVPRDRWTQDEPRWVIRHDEKHEPAVQVELTALNGNRYRLDRVYRHGEQSGWDWTLYRLSSRD